MTRWRKQPRHLMWLFIGPEVNFNFARNPLEIVEERSLTPPGIQAVAARRRRIVKWGGSHFLAWILITKGCSIMSYTYRESSLVEWW
ncbi:hypothetical protein Gorai_023140 [Gossypium raimondii]|uniref:Uncharacterized protein n=1 Tax=Gossypium raimondii TaxID=29730 RepID=A0A7J8NVJ1_GOSRA|nr:hypothetical protein [Gossypium raimondii]